jgi:aminoglycoside phosphotransferase (APT) family kinase protein
MTTDSQLLSIDVGAARGMARRLVTHHFGEKLNRIVHQPGGLSNFVFLVKHTAGDFVVRISPDPAKINAFIKEQWAMSKVLEAGIPTPEILEVGNEIVSAPYMISRRVIGQEGTFHPSRMQILHEMGRYAALINSIVTTGFGATFDWSNNQLSRNHTWEAFLHKELNIQARLEVMEKHSILPLGHSKRIRLILEGMAGLSLRPALNHGDIRLKNVIVDADGLITAIVDWEHCMSNVPPWELSVALHDLSVDEKQEFLEGYGLRDRELAELAPLIKALNVINYAPELERLLESNDIVRLERYRTRLSGALDLYSF